MSPNVTSSESLIHIDLNISMYICKLWDKKYPQMHFVMGKVQDDGFAGNYNSVEGLLHFHQKI